ncbi:titin isoform X1 [Monomorium pharaonis]|uniref:titin isoform X1 n=1 Tax=Monomorium pharaonis TaxID=307658 RepID=UPI001745E9DD|nr:titin isoform X1 [Monomorium pharaonis]
MGGYAWVTLATNDAYSLGALVLAHSLRRVGTKYELACLVTPGVTATMREKLAAVFSFVQEVNVLDSKDEANLALLARPELGITFTKLHCWRLTQYEKCVFVDADALVVRNCDELFEREELSAAPDVGWPDCFNSGVFVFRPSQQTFASITAFAAAKGSFDGGDQGLLNMYFSDWATKDISKHLPFIYNMCSTAMYSYLPAFKQFGDDVRIIHFIGITKPWLQYFDTLSGTVQPASESTHLQPLLQLWWNIFCERVHPQLSPSMQSSEQLHSIINKTRAGIAGALAQITLGAARSAEQVALEEHMRKQSWEQGQIDYMGRDSFDNIWKKICETLSFAPQRQPTPPKEDTATLETAVKETVGAPVDEVNKLAVETDKDPTQSLVCEIPKEEKLSATQSPEQKASELFSEKNVTIEAAATKVPGEPVQLPADVCIKSTTMEAKDVKSHDVCTEVPLSQLLAECPLPARTIAEQCELVSPQTTQETPPQSGSLLPEAEKPQQADSQTFPMICKFPQEPVTPIKQTTELTPIEAKPPVFAAQDATQPAASISMDSSQDTITSPVVSKASVEDTAKRVIDSAPAVTQPLTVDPGEQHAEMLLAASEVSTVSPVPIQVAESVLQAEPKESVLGAAIIVSDQAIATTITAVHESTDVASVPTPMQPVQLNGSACEVQRRDDVTTSAILIPSSGKTDAPLEAAKESASDLVTRKDIPLEAPPAIEEKILTSSSVVPEISPAEKLAEQIVTKTEVVEPKASEQTAKTETEQTKPEQIPKTETEKVKPPEQITKIEATEEKPEQVAKAETTEVVVKQAETIVQTETTATSAEQVEVAEAAELPSEIPESPIAELTEEPIEAKPPNIPSTPTVIEATPPISPSVESAQEMEEAAAAKKTLKKSDSTDEKGAKKMVKKVTKKPKTKSEEATAPSAATEGAAAAAADNSQNKSAKKTVKTTKKTGGAKALETDTSVPETPPPPATPTSADVPVPPKRKTKGPNSKGTGKKPETEE